MKKLKAITLTLAIFIATASFPFASVSADTMYAENGDTIEVESAEVENYQNLGWFKAPVQRLYKENDQTALYFKADVEAALESGWYTEPVQKLYAEDGRSEIVYKRDVEAQLSVGWYTYPLRRVYAEDGRSQIVDPGEVWELASVGWYTEPVQRLYNEDGTSEIFTQSVVPSYLASGWYAEPVQKLYAADGREAIFLKSEVEAQLTVGWFTTPQIDMGYKKAYADVLKNALATAIERNFGGQRGFSFIYLDNDDTPELVYYLDASGAGCAEIYTYANGNALPVCHYDSVLDTFSNVYGKYGRFNYREKEGIFVSPYWGHGDEILTFYQMAGDAATKTAVLRGSQDNNYYEVNNIAVSFDEYMQARTECGFNGGYYTTYGYSDSSDNSYELNEENIKELLGY